MAYPSGGTLPSPLTDEEYHRRYCSCTCHPKKEVVPASGLLDDDPEHLKISLDKVRQ